MIRRFTLLTVLISSLLAGCAASKTELKLVVAEIPDSMLHCLPAPYRDKKVIKVSPEMAAYLIAKYKTAHEDCQAKLGEVRTLYYKWKTKIGKK